MNTWRAEITSMSTVYKKMSHHEHAQKNWCMARSLALFVAWSPPSMLPTTALILNHILARDEVRECRSHPLFITGAYSFEEMKQDWSSSLLHAAEEDAQRSWTKDLGRGGQVCKYDHRARTVGSNNRSFFS